MAAIDMALPLSAIVETYRAQLEAFAAKREKYLLYGTGDCSVVASHAPVVPASSIR
jgi:hypothetical protein